MPKKEVDRRVKRTRQQLKEAMLSLIREKGFEAMTVQDIIDRADVGRSTFYAHFGGKEDLLVQGLDEVRDALKESQGRARLAGAGADQRAFAFSDELFAHAHGHRDVFRAMVGKRSGVVLQRRFQKMLTELLREEVHDLAGGADVGQVPPEGLVQYLVGGLFGLLAWWADTQSRASAEEMSALFRRLAVQAMKTARETRGAAQGRPGPWTPPPRAALAR